MTRPDAAAVVGAVLTGGASRRFGSDKAVADVGGRPLAARVVAALRGAGCDPVVALGGTAGPLLGIPTVPDRHPGEGPLVALADALAWLGQGLLVTAPCDHPLLTAADLEPLITAAGPDKAAVAALDGHPEPSLGVWPASWALLLRRATKDGKRAFRDALEVGPWTSVELRPEALADADTVDELEQLLRSGGHGTEPTSTNRDCPAPHAPA